MVFQTTYPKNLRFFILSFIFVQSRMLDFKTIQKDSAPN